MPKVSIKDEPTKKMGAEVPRQLNRRVWRVVIDRGIRIQDAIVEALELWLERHETNERQRK